MVYCLKIPTVEDIDRITKAFALDMKSFTIKDKRRNEIRPVICSVCDSMPTEAHWGTFVDIDTFTTLCKTCKIKKDDSLKTYVPELRKQYTAKDSRLKDFILSPETYVNENNKVLVCKHCLSELETNARKHKDRRRPPTESIINGYMIGEAPFQLSDLNPVELSLISKTVVQCQSWIFFGGCHQSIKGWHTFFKGRPGENVGNMTMMTESGWIGRLIVVLCGPFTTEQNRITREKVMVDPNKVVDGWRWLIHFNFKYSGLSVPPINSIPKPYILDQER